MEVLAAAVALLVAADILLTLAVIRRMREHTDRLGRLERMMGPPLEEMVEALKGRRMPDFAAVTSTGNPVTSDDLTGEVDVLAFLSSDCSACTSEASEFIDAVRGGKLPAVAAVVSGQGPNRDALVGDLADVCTVVLDEDGAITGSFQVPGVPSLLTLDDHGVVVTVTMSVRELVGALTS